MKLLSSLLRLFFYLLYGPLAWTYDFVAWTVSLGRWQDWVRAVIPFILGERVLELGHGPGHLQRGLLDLGLRPFGLDRSSQMGALAIQRLSSSGYTKTNLVRGLAQALPYPGESFDSLIATFPSEYFFDPRSLSEAHRTLKNRGRFIVLPVAWITGKGALDRMMAWIFRITHQSPSDPVEVICGNLKKPFEEAGFDVEIHQVDVKSSLLLVVVARK